MNTITGRWPVCEAPEVLLKVRSSAWHYLASEMNTEDDVLVLVRSGAGWMAGVLPRDFPGTPDSALKANLGSYTVLIPQTENLRELQGLTLEYGAQGLAVV